MKKLLAILGVLVVVGVVLLFVFSKAIGSGIKAGVETFGPEVTQTPITLDAVELSAFSGSGSISGLVVGNPEGFNTPHSIKLDGFSMKLEPLSLLSDKIVINEIIIESPEFILETGIGLQKSNIGKILENIEAFTGPSEETEESGSSKSIQIDLLRISEAKVKLSNKLMGGQALMVPLPNIELTDIGAEDEGVSMGESLKIVFQAINQGVVSAAGNTGKVVGDQLKNVGDATQKGVGGLLKGLKKAVEGEK
jgi:uncharacterized protein involved in outer membrane biogenesis